MDEPNNIELGEIKHKKKSSSKIKKDGEKNVKAKRTKTKKNKKEYAVDIVELKESEEPIELKESEEPIELKESEEPIELKESGDQVIKKYVPPYRSDSCAISIDGLRTLSVLCMYFKTFVQRMTKSDNPITKALGYDWIPAAFAYATGARFAAEMKVFEHNLYLNRDNPRLCREMRIENYVRSLFANFAVYVFACLLIIVTLSHEQVCMWDILHTNVISATIMYPFMRTNHLMLPMLLTLLMFIFTPVM